MGSYGKLSSKAWKTRVWLLYRFKCLSHWWVSYDLVILPFLVQRGRHLKMEISLINVNFSYKRVTYSLLELFLCLLFLKNDHLKIILWQRDIFWSGIFCSPSVPFLLFYVFKKLKGGQCASSVEQEGRAERDEREEVSSDLLAQWGLFQVKGKLSVGTLSLCFLRNRAWNENFCASWNDSGKEARLRD